MQTKHVFSFQSMTELRKLEQEAQALKRELMVRVLHSLTYLRVYIHDTVWPTFIQTHCVSACCNVHIFKK